MTNARRLALKISRAVLRMAPPGVQDWAKAMLCEMDFIESDWTALLWALSGTRILFRIKSRCLPREVPVTGVADIPRAAQNLADRVHARTLSVVVTVFESVAFGCILFLVRNPIQRLGSLLTIAAMLYMTYQLLARRVREVSSDDRTDRTISYRAELERQRDFHRGWWFWSRLAIMLAGLLLFCIGGVLAEPGYLPGYTALAACFVGVCTRARSTNWMPYEERRGETGF